MKQSVRVIKTQQDYEAALARLSALMDENFTPGSDKESELELLALVIESYERDKLDPVVADPVEAILFRMEQQNLQKKDLIPYLGSLSKVSEVLSRKRPLSISMMRKLHKGLDIPADVLLGNGMQDEVDLSTDPSVDYSKFPLREMIDRGCFKSFSGSLKEAKDRTEELIRKFMRGFEPLTLSSCRLRAPLAQGGVRLMDEYALMVWHILVLNKARAQSLRGKYKAETISKDWLRDLTKLSRFEKGPLLAQEFLADAGISLVIEDHFNKTYLDGAAMLDDGRPIVALTLRHDRIDNFWFALLHELVHVQKHLTPAHSFIADNLDDKARSGMEEQEADAGALEALIPKNEWMKSEVRKHPIKANAFALAEKLRIHPAIVAGRARYEANNWKLLPSIQGSVREHFIDQLEEHAAIS